MFSWCFLVVKNVFLMFSGCFQCFLIVLNVFQMFFRCFINVLSMFYQCYFNVKHSNSNILFILLFPTRFHEIPFHFYDIPKRDKWMTLYQFALHFLMLLYIKICLNLKNAWSQSSRTKHLIQKCFFTIYNLHNILLHACYDFSVPTSKSEQQNQTWNIDLCINVWKFSSWIQSCFPFTCMQISDSPFFPFVQNPFVLLLLWIFRSNSWTRLTYADEIFTVYEDIKKVTHFQLMRFSAFPFFRPDSIQSTYDFHFSSSSSFFLHRLLLS